MKDAQLPFEERPPHSFETELWPVDTRWEQADDLVQSGFRWEEAVKLVQLREHLYDNSEVRQRMAADHRMLFVRWLYEHGEMDEN